MHLSIGRDRLVGEIVLATFDERARPIEALVQAGGQQFRYGFDDSGDFRFASCLEVRNQEWGDRLWDGWVVADQHPSDERHMIYVRPGTVALLGENDVGLGGLTLYLMGWQLVHELPFNPFEGRHDGTQAQQCELCQTTFPNDHLCHHLAARVSAERKQNEALLRAVSERKKLYPMPDVL